MDAAVERIIAEEKPDASDTHPPVRERIARFEAAGRAAVDRTDGNRPATDLLAGGSPWLDAAEGELLVQDRPLATWDEVITAGVRRGVESEADELGASMRAMKLGDGGLDSVLRLVDDPADGGAARRLAGTRPDAREAAAATLWNRK